MTADGEHLLEIIQTQNEIASGGLDLPAVMDLVARRAVELTNAGGAIIEMAEGTETVYAVGAGSGRDHVGTRVPMEGSLSGLCVRTGQVLSSDNTDSDDRADPGVCEAIGAGSMIVVPLVHAGSTVGTLNIFSPAIYHFRSKDVEILRLLAGLVSANMAKSEDFRSEVGSSRTDPLTGLGNRRAYEEALAGELSRSRRQDGHVAVCLFGVDPREQVDPAALEEALCEVARILDGGRLTDAAFRLEDREFAMILPETDEDGARAAGGRISARLADTIMGGGRLRVSWGAAAGELGPAELHAKAEGRLREMRAGAPAG